MTSKSESPALTWSIYILYGVTLAGSVAGTMDCWPEAFVGTLLGWGVGAGFLAFYVPHLRDAMNRWLKERAVAKERRRRQRRSQRRH
ncbi:MAG: hypothetical protein F4Z15_06570 [Gammaproteobacteria bacterium]|nr:hypothetical protein [Gammaproteobacteria bacterium]MYJ12637.1 hypothetical protein [Gemmatimonadota bacterium]